MENKLPLQATINGSKTNTRKINETGHARNNANLQLLTAFAESYGPTYNPGKFILQLPQLHSLSLSCNTVVHDVTLRNADYNHIINIRAIAFAELNEYATRLINTLETTEASKEKINDAKGFVRKLRGQRAGKLSTQTSPDTPAPVTISVSQRSFVQQIQHFSGLIAVLETEASYMPNEAALHIAAAKAKRDELIEKNNAVFTAHAIISGARNARDKALYHPETGLVTIALEVKKYIKAVFGASSLEYQNVKGIPFRIVLNR